MLANVRSFLVVTASLVFLAACGGSVDVGLVCNHNEAQDRSDCGLGPRVFWELKSVPPTVKSNFDAGLFSVDLSQSNVPIDSTSGYATVTLDLADGSTVANSFQWIRVGDEFVAANPSAINAWLQPYLPDLEEADADIDFVTGSDAGANVVVAELKYAGALHGGASSSWCSGGGGGGGCGGHCEIE